MGELSTSYVTIHWPNYQFEIRIDLISISNIHNFLTIGPIHFKLLPFCFCYFSAFIQINLLQGFDCPLIHEIYESYNLLSFRGVEWFQGVSFFFFIWAISLIKHNAGVNKYVWSDAALFEIR